MKHQARQRAALGLALLLAAGGAIAQAQRDDAERELSRLQQVITGLQQELRSARAQRSAASRALEDHERAIADLGRARRALEATARELGSELDRLEAARRRLESQADGEREALARQLRVVWVMGREDRMKLLLERRDPGDIARLLRYHGYFTRERRERIAALSDTLARLDTTVQAIARESARLEAVRAEQARREAEMVAERARRADAVAALDLELRESSARLAGLERDRDRLEELLRRLREAINDIPAELEPPRSFAELRGRLPWPLPGRLARRFGTPREEAGLAWQGVLLEAPPGGDVRAVAHGRVVFADWLRGFGQLLILDHGGGYMSLYGHNESLLRSPGEWVNPGDVVATVGDSGGHDRAGLYFEIRRDGRPEDPVRWCSDRARFRAAL